MNYTNLLKSAVKGSAPIVAIPIEGKAPFIVRTRRLKGWVKGVKVERIEVRQNPDMIEYRRPAPRYVYELKQIVQPEGPEERIAIPQPRVLLLEGAPEKNPGRIRCRASFLPIPRREAIEELGKWADKERERQTKKRNLGALGLTAKERKKMARARYEEDAEGMVTVMCRVEKHPEHVLSSYWDQDCRRMVYTCSCGEWRSTDVQSHRKAHSEHAGSYKEAKQGIPASIPECPELEFVLVRWGDHNEDNVEFTVTETITGRSAGSGKAAIEALAEARANWRKLTGERRAEMVGKIRGELVALI